MTYRLNAKPVVPLPPPVPPAKELRGRYISLTPLATECKVLFERLFAVSHGDAAREAVWDFLPYGPFADAEEMRRCYAEMADAGDPQFYAVIHADGAAGVVSYLRMSPLSHSIEIGHIWHAADRQRGRANTEAAFLLISNAFALGYRRLEWKCNALNMRSRRAALRLGLAFEGVFRQCTVAKGKNRDTAWFALVDGDWPAAQANFEKWLTAPLGDYSLTSHNLPLVEWSLSAHDFWAAEE